MCYAYIQYLSEACGFLSGFLKSHVLKLALKQACVVAAIVEQCILKVHIGNTEVVQVSFLSNSVHPSITSSSSLAALQPYNLQCT